MGKIELFDIKKDYDLIIQRVKEQYGYDDNLSNTLRKILPAMLTGRSYEERNLFYKMLTKTPIIVLPKDGDIRETSKKMFEGLNKNIINENKETSSWKPEGLFSSELIFDDQLNVVGKKQALFIKTLDGIKSLTESQRKRMELFGTGLEVSHLIHELGHAWVSEKINILEMIEET